MNTFVTFVRRHPVIVLVYSLYALFWCRFVWVGIIQDGMTGMARLTVGEGLVFLWFFGLFISLVYLVVSLGQAFFIKEKRKLYLILSLIVFIPPLISTIIGFLP